MQNTTQTLTEAESVARQHLAKIQALGPDVTRDAARCAHADDLSGLAYILNMASGVSGALSRKFGELADLSDLLKVAHPL